MLDAAAAALFRVVDVGEVMVVVCCVVVDNVVSVFVVVVVLGYAKKKYRGRKREIKNLANKQHFHFGYAKTLKKIFSSFLWPIKYSSKRWEA